MGMVKEQRTHVFLRTSLSVSERVLEYSSAFARQRHTELIMRKERRDILDQGAGAYITMHHYAYEYKCTLGVATINAGRRAAGSLNSALPHVHVVAAEQRK